MVDRVTKTEVTATEDFTVRDAARSRLVSVLEHALRLLILLCVFHEELWQRLRARVQSFCMKLSRGIADHMLTTYRRAVPI